jgi:chorismate mutase/prephenate dehydratase
MESLREKIDAIDDQLIELLMQRAELATQIGEFKRQHSLPIFAPEREAQILKKVPQKITPIFESILSMSRDLQRIVGE